MRSKCTSPRRLERRSRSSAARTTAPLKPASSSTFAVNPSLYRKLPYDPSKDLSPVTMTGRFALLLVVNPAKLGAASVAQLIEAAKQAAGKLDYASPGPGSPHHLAMEMFAVESGLRPLHVPFTGAGPALNALLAGEVDYRLTAMVKKVDVAAALKMPGVRAVLKDGDVGPNIPWFSGRGGFSSRLFDTHCRYEGDEVAARIIYDFGKGNAGLVTHAVKMLGMTQLEFDVVVSGGDVANMPWPRLEAFLMSVLERTHEFGVMQAVGNRPSRVVATVIAERPAQPFLVLAPFGPLNLNTGDRFDARTRFNRLDDLPLHVDRGLKITIPPQA